MTRLPHMTLVRRPQPFTHPQYLFEVKMDGFRAHAYVNDGRCELVSRSGFTYKRFTHLIEQIASSLRVTDAVIDGEIVCLDNEGRSQFNNLMFRRGTPYFYAFDLLWLNGRDLRTLPLIERKARLKRIARQPVLFMEHVEEKGEKLFELICARDLEGVVAKVRDGAYDCEHMTTWVKIKNPAYSQIIGRDKLFERRTQ